MRDKLEYAPQEDNKRSACKKQDEGVNDLGSDAFYRSLIERT